MSILGSLLSSVTGGAWDYWQQQQQNKFNEHMQRNANNFSLDMWNRNNEYNTPANQMSRLRDAGLNPQLAMGGSSVMNTSSLSPQGATGSSSNIASHLDFSQAIKDISEAELAKKQQKQSDAQTNVLDTVAHNNREQAKLLQQQILGAKLDNIAKGLSNRINTFKVETGIVGDDSLSNVTRSVLGSVKSFKDWAGKKIDKLFKLPSGDLEELSKISNKK